MRCIASLHKVESTRLAWECSKRKNQKGVFWIKIWNYRILCFAMGKKKKMKIKDIDGHRKSAAGWMSYLHAKGKGRGFKRMGKQGPPFWRRWSQRLRRRGQPPCQAAVNKALAELKNGNEFLIGDTLYLSSWQRSDGAAAFLVLPLCAHYFPLGAPAWYPPCVRVPHVWSKKKNIIIEHQLER